MHYYYINKDDLYEFSDDGEARLYGCEGGEQGEYFFYITEVDGSYTWDLESTHGGNVATISGGVFDRFNDALYDYNTDSRVEDLFGGAYDY